MLRLVAAAVLLAAPVSDVLAHDHHNTLTPAEQAAGWKLLFDGTTTSGWRGYKKPGFPDKGWAVEEGTLKTTSGGGDIVTVDQYGDFELQLEWKASPKANSGIMFRVAEKHDYPWMTGPEFQILDDAGTGEAANGKHAAGALYDIIAAPNDKPLKPAGEWNHARIWCRNGMVKHFLNGMKVAEYRIDNDTWKQAIAASKFKGFEGFGMQPKGHLAIQDHGDTLWYRNIKVRDLGADMPGQVALFNGKDLAGWTYFLNDGAKMEQVWSVKDGTIVCAGKPAGYIRTEKDYTNFVLKLQWRFSPDKGGNSGVLLRAQAPDKVWPKSIEAQLMSQNAGDFWNIDEFKMTVDPARTKGRNTKKLVMAERPLGDWNEYEIVVNKGDVALWVNGELCNTAKDAQEIAGKIGLQSEGAEISFKDIRVSPLP